MAGAFAVRFFRQLTFFGKIFTTHTMAICKTLNLLRHASAKRRSLSRLHVRQSLFESFLRSFAVDNPIRFACYFIPSAIIHSEDLVNININTHARK
jgi:hypothetical protein